MKNHFAPGVMIGNVVLLLLFLFFNNEREGAFSSSGLWRAESLAGHTGMAGNRLELVMRAYSSKQNLISASFSGFLSLPHSPRS